MRRRTVFALLLATVMLPGAPAAVAGGSDLRRFPLPEWSEGWRFGGEGVSISDERTAISGTMSGRPTPDSTARITRSVIVQYGENAPPPLEFGSKALAQGYAADGATLLVSQIVPDGDRPCENCPLRFLILGPDGVERWRSDVRRNRTYSFVPDRTAIFAAAECSYVECHGEEIELRDLRGALIAKVRPSAGFSAAIPLAGGEEFVLFHDDRVERLGIIGGLTLRWRVEHELGRPELRPRRLDSGAIVVRAGRELWIVDSGTGAIELLTAAKLAAIDGTRTADEYGTIGIDRGPTPTTVWIHNHTGDRVLDLETATIREIDVDRSAPEGYSSPHPTAMAPYRSGQYHVFVDRHTVFVRSIWAR